MERRGRRVQSLERGSDLGNLIRRTRQQQGINQTELSKLTRKFDPYGGVSASYISRLESGQIKDPSLSVKEALGKVLGIPSEELTTLEPMERVRARYTADSVISALRPLIELQNQQIEALKLEVQRVSELLDSFQK
jgi:transcriptional regulator with XRE-family HTH domain